MIISEVFYGIQCNRCSEVHESNEISFWSDEVVAEEEAMENEWHRDNGKHYCPNCYEINNDGEAIIYAEYPKHLIELNTFISKVIKIGIGEVVEFGEQFKVKIRLFNSKKLEAYKEEAIKSLLHKNFISLEYSPSNTNRDFCEITIKK